MHEVPTWLVEFWNGLSLLDLIGCTLLGALLGIALGVLTWRWLRRRDWLARRRRWHHLLLACYVVVLPLFGGLVGLHIGLVAGLHRAAYAELDYFEPRLQALGQRWRGELEDALHDRQLVALLHDPRSTRRTLVEVMQRTLQAHPIPGSANLREHRWSRWLLQRLEWARADALAGVAAQAAVGEVAAAGGIDGAVSREAMGMRIDELLQARSVLKLVKHQVNAMMWGVYLGMLVPLLIAAALVTLEIVLAIRLGWRAERPEAVRSALPAA